MRSRLRMARYVGAAAAMLTIPIRRRIASLGAPDAGVPRFVDERTSVSAVCASWPALGGPAPQPRSCTIFVISAELSGDEPLGVEMQMKPGRLNLRRSFTIFRRGDCPL